jgi:uncharacterized protein (UPF0276 family)
MSVSTGMRIFLFPGECQEVRMTTNRAPRGVGLGFRLKIAREFLATPTTHAQFLEIAPENYLRVGGNRARLLAAAAERLPIVCHGLCGDFAGSAPVDEEYLSDLKGFLHRLGVRWYSDHLCLTRAAGAELHDLLPLPHSEKAAKRAAARIREVRDRLDLPVAIENASAYARMPGEEMSESEFCKLVLEEADCLMLLDVNNVYVNSVNFGFDPRAFIDSLPLERVVQLHIAGHTVEREGLLVDTHGAPIVDPVYELFAYTLSKLPEPAPVLLERDTNIPPLHELEAELEKLTKLMEAADG